MASPPHIEHRPVPADPPVDDLAADIEFAHAAEAHAKPARHLLLHRDLAGQAELARQALLHAQQAAEPQVKKASQRPAAISPRSSRSTLPGPLVPSESVTVMTSTP